MLCTQQEFSFFIQIGYWLDNRYNAIHSTQRPKNKQNALSTTRLIMTTLVLWTEHPLQNDMRK